jgi:hypothetical protein
MVAALMRGGPSSLANLGLRLGETVDFTVRGACMRGVESGEVLGCRRQRLYWPGDVVVVRRRDHWNVHRFLGYAPTQRGMVALTQADDASERDPVAPTSAIVGRARCPVTASERAFALGKFAHALMRRATRAGR